MATTLGTTLAEMPAVAGGIHRPSDHLDPQQVALLQDTRWEQWRHGDFWLAKLRAQAVAADHLVVVSPPDRATAISVLGVDAAHVTDVPNGVEIDRFHPQAYSAAERRAQVPTVARGGSAGLGRIGPPGIRRVSGTMTSTGSWAPRVMRQS